jgi:1-acyl-sn-glycerol-3-phosphate acyltransferase
VTSLQQDNAPSLIIFPEGTRTQKDEQINEFQRGAANIAIRADVPIRPVLIRCTPTTLTKNEKWYHIPAKPFHIEIKILDAIHISEVLSDLTVSPKNVRALNQYLQQFLSKSYLNEQFGQRIKTNDY